MANINKLVHPFLSHKKNNVNGALWDNMRDPTDRKGVVDFIPTISLQAHPFLGAPDASLNVKGTKESGRSTTIKDEYYRIARNIAAIGQNEQDGFIMKYAEEYGGVYNLEKRMAKINQLQNTVDAQRKLATKNSEISEDEQIAMLSQMQTSSNELEAIKTIHLYESEAFSSPKPKGQKERDREERVDSLF